jgi:flagellar protein FliS
MYGYAGQAAARARYRDIDIASKVGGASPHGLIAVLFEELTRTLDTLAVGIGPNGTLSRSGIIERRARANSILLGLEGSLDFAQGGNLAQNLSAIYREARRLIASAIADRDPATLGQARAMIAEIAEAWNQIG